MFIFKKSSHWIIFLKFGLPLQNEQFDLWTSQFRRPQKKLFRIISIFCLTLSITNNVNFLPFLWSNNRLLWAKHCLYVVNQINSLGAALWRNNNSPAQKIAGHKLTHDSLCMERTPNWCEEDPKNIGFEKKLYRGKRRKRHSVVQRDPSRS